MFIAQDDRQIRGLTGKLPGELIRNMLARYRSLPQSDRHEAVATRGLFAVYATGAELEDDLYGLYDERGNLLAFEDIEEADLPRPYLITQRRTHCGLTLMCYVPAKIAPRELADLTQANEGVC